MPSFSSALHPKEYAQKAIPLAVVGNRSLEERPIGKFKSLWEDNKQIWRQSPVMAAILNTTALTALGMSVWLGGILVNNVGLSEHAGQVQVESRSFVPAHDEVAGAKFLVHKEDAWYVSGKIQGQDATQTVEVEVSQKEYQQVKEGESIPVEFSQSRLTHALEARRTSASQEPTLSKPSSTP